MCVLGGTHGTLCFLEVFSYFVFEPACTSLQEAPLSLSELVASGRASSPRALSLPTRTPPRWPHPNQNVQEMLKHVQGRVTMS